jgi:hypothetical protein
LADLPGVDNVEVTGGNVTCSADGVTPDKIVATIKEAGFGAEHIKQ